MFEKVKKWIRKHQEEVIITASVLALTGTVVALISNRNKVATPIKKFAERIVPDASKAANHNSNVLETAKNVTPLLAQVDDVVTDNDVINTFPRSGYIRHLHEGHLASPKKLAQAIDMGIDLKPGYTIVDPCRVKQRAA